MGNSLVVAGVDVGGEKKGFHAVALQDGRYLDQIESREVAKIAQWCRRLGAQFIGVDAPCRWSLTGRARPADRLLMGKGVWCFSTPSEKAAQDHPKQHFRWMQNGADLFAALEPSHPLFFGEEKFGSSPACFETFPHAVACALAGKVVSAKEKRNDRLRLVREAGVEFPAQPKIDFIDAALCAVTADYFSRGEIVKVGEPGTGFIVVPKVPGSTLFPADLCAKA